MTIDYCTGQDCWVCHVLRHEESPPVATGQVPVPHRPVG